MSEIVKHLIDKNNNIIIPITKAANVETSDGGNVQAKFNQVNEQITNLTNLDAKINAANRKIDEKSAEIGQRIDDEVDNILLSVAQINRDLDTVEQEITTINEPFIISLTQTNPDRSGTMDKTPSEIAAAVRSGKRIKIKYAPENSTEYCFDVVQCVINDPFSTDADNVYVVGSYIWNPGSLELITFTTSTTDATYTARRFVLTEAPNVGGGGN